MTALLQRLNERVLGENPTVDLYLGTLDINKFKNINNSLKMEDVVVYLPKFKFDTEYNMNDALSTMGMPMAFSYNNADFTGMYDKDKIKSVYENLYIDLIIHKAYVDVNEEGTEAVAATAVLMQPIMAIAPPEPKKPKIFNADHQFIFAIVHEATGTILFLGKVNDPSSIS